MQFKTRVAQGRKKDINYIDSIAQGRVWSGEDAIANGLVDRVGNLYDAISSAAKLAKLDDYGTREYPESGSWIDELLGRNKVEPTAMMREQLGDEYFNAYQQLLKIRELTQSVQARIPFDIHIR
jgi:protease-4